MKIRISTPVTAELSRVQSRFTEELFMDLNPPFPPVKLLEFGGCKEGDIVALELNFIFFKQKWVSEITEEHETDQSWLFVDEGKKLPFFLARWKHRHITERTDNGSMIIDDITFSTGTILTDMLMYPVLWLQFLYRKPIYKRKFS